MGASSSSDAAYIAKSEGDKHGDVTNIMAIKSSSAFTMDDMATGDPLKCNSCEAILNKFSIVKPDEEKCKYSWICEFCGEINHVHLEEGEFPKKETSTYVLEKNDKPLPDVVKSLDDITVIFCIDVSGSMDMTSKTDIESKYNKFKGCISRLECVKLAIDQQISELYANNKNIKIGFILFEHKVKIIGDGSKSEIILKEEIYKSYEALFETSLALVDNFNLPIGSSNIQLLQKLKDIESGGSTALGPGLLAATAIASKGKPGSKVILCTDGLANIGIGAVDNAKKAVESSKFYEKLGLFAKERGISISLICLVEKECRLDSLSPVANMTGGRIIRVDPQKLDAQFKNLLKDQIIATNVSVKVRLHKALEFANEVYGTIMGSTMFREIGNATGKTEMTFEYKARSLEELKKIPNFDIATMKVIPMQALITFKNVDGLKLMKVINVQIPVAKSIEEHEKHIRKEVYYGHSQQQSAKMASMGMYKEAKVNIERHKKRLKEAVICEESKHEDMDKERGLEIGKLEKALEVQVKAEEKASASKVKSEVVDELAEEMNFNMFA